MVNKSIFCLAELPIKVTEIGLHPWLFTHILIHIDYMCTHAHVTEWIAQLSVHLYQCYIHALRQARSCRSKSSCV